MDNNNFEDILSFGITDDNKVNDDLNASSSGKMSQMQINFAKFYESLSEENKKKFRSEYGKYMAFLLKEKQYLDIHKNTGHISTNRSEVDAMGTELEEFDKDKVMDLVNRILRLLPEKVSKWFVADKMTGEELSKYVTYTYKDGKEYIAEIKVSGRLYYSETEYEPIYISIKQHNAELRYELSSCIFAVYPNFEHVLHMDHLAESNAKRSIDFIERIAFIALYGR